ncbi:Hypothetical predicted protein, partial [Lynx pardinus]
ILLSDPAQGPSVLAAKTWAAEAGMWRLNNLLCAEKEEHENVSNEANNNPSFKSCFSHFVLETKVIQGIHAQSPPNRTLPRHRWPCRSSPAGPSRLVWFLHQKCEIFCHHIHLGNARSISSGFSPKTDGHAHWAGPSSGS